MTTHPLQSIAEMGAKPMPKLVALRSNNPGTQGMVWAQTAIALCLSTASQWTVLAHQLFGMTIEDREAAIKAWRDWRTAKIKAHESGEEQHPPMDAKTFKRIMGTAATRLSHMSGIAKAITAGMDYEALRVHYNMPTADDAKTLSIDEMYDIAKQYSKSTAGRTADSFMVKLGKFLEASAKTLDEKDANTYNKVVEFVNSLN